MDKEFGKPNKSKLDKLADLTVRHCQQRNPEALDRIFDHQSPIDNQEMLEKVIPVLSSDLDTLSWLCGYLASEINHTEDNNKPHPIRELSRLLISVGMKLFEDFTPYPVCRIMIANTKKFEALPQDIQNRVYQFFDIYETTSEETQLMNEAILQEFTTYR